MFNLTMPDSSTVPLPDKDGEVSRKFGYPIHQQNGIVDFLEHSEASKNLTADHYSEQWGPGLNFQQFIKANPQALKHMPSGQLGWADVVARIRTRAQNEQVLVYEGACGYGGIFSALFAPPIPPHLRYIGADIHRALSNIERPKELPLSSARFVRWDISDPLPIAEKFDYVICRNALMMTPDPRKTLRSLASALAPNGTMAVSVYATKPLLREKLDDALRELIIPMSIPEAFEVSHEFTLLGRDLRASQGRIVLRQDLPFLGMKAGEYDIQTFIYDNIVKCWHNDVFGERNSDIVNFDWYHPPFAFRYSMEDFLAMFSGLGLEVKKTLSIPAQHYAEAVKQPNS